jgi:hypothetical protein
MNVEGCKTMEAEKEIQETVERNGNFKVVI